MTPDERTIILRRLANAITAHRLAAPARLALDVVAPLGFLAGQVALFTRPLLPSADWRSYASALADEQAWHELRALVDR
jgi:hypothetical protein